MLHGKCLDKTLVREDFNLLEERSQYIKECIQEAARENLDIDGQNLNERGENDNMRKEVSLDAHIDPFQAASFVSFCFIPETIRVVPVIMSQVGVPPPPKKNLISSPCSLLAFISEFSFSCVHPHWPPSDIKGARVATGRLWIGLETSKW